MIQYLTFINEIKVYVFLSFRIVNKLYPCMFNIIKACFQYVDQYGPIMLQSIKLINKTYNYLTLEVLCSLLPNCKEN